jgi:hypothetical protein
MRKHSQFLGWESDSGLSEYYMAEEFTQLQQTGVEGKIKSIS